MVVVVKLPTVNYPTSFPLTQKQLTIEQFITKLAIEALHVTIFPWAAWRNEQRFDSSLFQPFGELPGHEFGPVVATNMFGRSAYGKQVL